MDFTGGVSESIKIHDGGLTDDDESKKALFDVRKKCTIVFVIFCSHTYFTSHSHIILIVIGFN